MTYNQEIPGVQVVRNPDWTISRDRSDFCHGKCSGTSSEGKQKFSMHFEHE